MAAIWLQLEHVAIGEILASTSALRRELAPLAALNMDEEGYGELAAFLEHDRAIDEKDYGFTVFLKAELQQNNIIGRLSRNRVLYLYLRISLDLVASLSPADDILLGKRSRYLDFRHQRNRMIDAVLARDPDIARLEADRCGDKIRKWMEIDARKKKGARTGTAATRVDGAAS
jgi:DNA-binding FadR family transcriptional regulator